LPRILDVLLVDRVLVMVHLCCQRMASESRLAAPCSAVHKRTARQNQRSSVGSYRACCQIHRSVGGLQTVRRIVRNHPDCQDQRSFRWHCA
jgi:hypothetical protein